MPRIPYTVVENNPVVLRVDHEGQTYEIQINLAVAGLEPTGKIVTVTEPHPEFKLDLNITIQTATVAI